MAKNTSFITRPGIAYWPYLQSPDQKYDSKYKTGLIVHADESKDLRETINKTFIEQFGDKKLSDASLSYEKASDTSEKVSQGIQELINKTNDKKLENYYLFKFSTQHKPTLWDCSKPSQKIESELNLRSGSIIQVHGKLNAYSYGNRTGVTCYLGMVRVIDAVQGSTSPFSDEVDGFVHHNDNAPSVDVAANGDF